MGWLCGESAEPARGHNGRGRCVLQELSTMVGTYKPLNNLLSLLTNSLLSNTNGLGFRRNEPIQMTACLLCLCNSRVSPSLL